MICRGNFYWSIHSNILTRRKSFFFKLHIRTPGMKVGQCCAKLVPKEGGSSSRLVWSLGDPLQSSGWGLNIANWDFLLSPLVGKMIGATELEICRKQCVFLQNLHRNMNFTHLFGKFTHTFSLKLLKFYISISVSTEKGLKSSILEFMLFYH